MRVLVLVGARAGDDAAPPGADLDLAAFDEGVDDLLEVVRVPVHVLPQRVAGRAAALRLELVDRFEQGAAVVADVADAPAAAPPTDDDLAELSQFVHHPFDLPGAPPGALELGEQGVAARRGAIIGEEAEEEFLIIRQSGHGRPALCPAVDKAIGPEYRGELMLLGVEGRSSGISSSLGAGRPAMARSSGGEFGGEDDVWRR